MIEIRNVPCCAARRKVFFRAASTPAQYCARWDVAPRSKRARGLRRPPPPVRTRQLRALLLDEEYREQVRLAAYAHGRGMIWSAAGRAYADAFTEARHHRPAEGTLLQATT